MERKRGKTDINTSVRNKIGNITKVLVAIKKVIKEYNK